jgi:putative transposase
VGMFKPRLRRLDWVYTPSPLYFLTACTLGRRKCLDNDPVHQCFIAFASRATQQGVWVGRYVLMPDHLHIFAAFAPQALTLSDWMKALKRTLAKTLRQAQVPPPHWQKGFFDHVLRSEESYHLKWAYVRENPVRAGLVSRADRWPYQGEIHSLDARGARG